MYETIPTDEIESISLLRATQGGPQMAVEVDPYCDAAHWHDAARGDGRSYGGVVETIRRLPGEPWEAFYARAEARADELNG